jgi:hypothetical protein
MFEENWIRARQTLNSLDSLRNQCKKSYEPAHRQHSGSARHFVIESAKRTRTGLLWTIRFDWCAFSKQLGLFNTDLACSPEHEEQDMKCCIPAEHMLMLQDQLDGLWPHRIRPIFAFSDAFNSTHGLLNAKVAVFGTQQQLQQLEVEAAANRRELSAAAVEAFERSRSCGNRTCVLCQKHYSDTHQLTDTATANACVAVTKDTCKQLITLCNSKNWCACWDIPLYNDVFAQCESSGVSVSKTVSRGCLVELDSTVISIMPAFINATTAADHDNFDQAAPMCMLLSVKVRTGSIMLSIPEVSAINCYSKV